MRRKRAGDGDRRGRKSVFLRTFVYNRRRKKLVSHSLSNMEAKGHGIVLAQRVEKLLKEWPILVL